MPNILLHPCYHYPLLIFQSTTETQPCWITHGMIGFRMNIQICHWNYCVPISIKYKYANNKAVAIDAQIKLLTTHIMHSANAPLQLCTIIHCWYHFYGFHTSSSHKSLPPVVFIFSLLVDKYYFYAAQWLWIDMEKLTLWILWYHPMLWDLLSTPSRCDIVCLYMLTMWLELFLFCILPVQENPIKFSKY